MPPPDPAQIGRYRLLKELGRGASGVVYEAVHRLPVRGDRRVALKVQSGDEKLHHEARIAGQLRHRNIVDVYEVGSVDGRSFCAMELCAGGPLSPLAPMGAQALVEVGLQVCAALSYAHEALELVHLDIKPDNLLLHGATVKLADLGIATARGFGRGRSVSGTLAYMPPEQRNGLPLDARADIYALARTLLVLSEPQGGVDAATLDFGDLDSLELPPGHAAASPGTPLPRSLQAVLDRATAPLPADRWPSARAFGAALAAVGIEGPGLAELVGGHHATDGLSPASGELPPPTPIFGRYGDLQRIDRALKQPCLVTLRGPAGIGKSCLAVRAARAWGRRVAYADAASAASAADLVVRVSQALAVPLLPASSEHWAEQLGRAMGARGEMLLLLDGLEPDADSRAVIERWLSLAPDLRILVTTRRRVGLAGELLLEVSSLDEAAGVALLRHGATRRGVTIPDSAEARELVALLDGIPLALELAAGRLGILSLADVRDRLAPTFLRSAGAGRHETLEAAFDWTWRLLSPAAQRALAGASVFQAPFSTVSANELLTPLMETPVSALTELHDHSMILLEGGRWRLYGQVRAYATRHRRLTGLDDALRRQHAGMFARHGSRDALATVWSPARGEARNRLVELLPELQAALAFCLDAGLQDVSAPLWLAAAPALDRLGQAERSARLGQEVAKSMRGGHPRMHDVARQRAKHLRRLGRGTEALRLLDAVEPEAGARSPFSMIIRASIAYDKGELSRAATLYAEAAARFTEISHPWYARTARTSLAGTLLRQGRYAEAEPLFSEVLRQNIEAKDSNGEALVRGNLANLLRQQGRWSEAAHSYELSLRIHRQFGDAREVGHILGNIAYMHRMRGDYGQAIQAFTEAIALAQAHGDRYSESIQFVNRGITLTADGDTERSEQDLRHSMEVAVDAGLTTVAAYAKVHQGRRASLCGDTDHARRLVREGTATLRNTGDRLVLAEALSIEAEVEWRAGEARRSTELLDRADGLIPENERETRAIIDRVRALIGEPPARSSMRSLRTLPDR